MNDDQIVWSIIRSIQRFEVETGVKPTDLLLSCLWMRSLERNLLKNRRSWDMKMFMGCYIHEVSSTNNVICKPLADETRFK